jgi:uncharacterized protein (UPF0332 family)
MIDVRECLRNAKKDDMKGKKHKGLLVVETDEARAKQYVSKAKANLELCDLFRQRDLDYKIPEEWFYTLYYCGLAILAKFGIESRSQRCTAAFLRYVKDRGLISYDDDFIDRIMVHRDKGESSDVDVREHARYSSLTRLTSVEAEYEKMTEICKKAIDQCEEIVYSKKRYEMPPELL